ncbi:hypothetical protein FEM48_Zijuj09G0144800 [Ziziphus jujuba var. spinosa]|uniref:Uncharacterized protein n=1 Tax=Ziziphus jujuba var. spinosa TaxID=714518 RepID=A0A978UTI5_ZIZJJ|nr:hypothetical protein FEM48_Zijuj09G0144800 [Ziziphus jujuba var. spinosa]
MEVCFYTIDLKYIACILSCFLISLMISGVKVSNAMSTMQWDARITSSLADSVAEKSLSDNLSFHFHGCKIDNLDSDFVKLASYEARRSFALI